MLGVIKIKSRDDSIDLNDYPINTLGIVGVSNANKPSGEGSALGVVLCLAVTNNRNGLWQFFVRWTSSKYIYFRAAHENGTWDPWRKFDVLDQW